MLIDVTRVVERIAAGRLPTGVERVCLAYVERWKSESQAILRFGRWRRVVGPDASQALFELLLRKPADFRARFYRLVVRACLPPWPEQQSNGRISFNLAYFGVDTPGLARWLASTGQRPVFFVHDLIPLTHPQYCRPGELERHVGRMETFLQTGAGLICNSQWTFDTLRDFAGHRRLPMPPVAVAPLAPAALPDPAGTEPPLRQPYFVVVASFEPRKNHLMLLQVWRRLVQERGADAPHLVLIGQRGWDCAKVVEQLAHCAELQGRVHELAACGDAELARWLRHARALLFPSIAEGFGMPLVEALALGTPVLASDIEVFREVGAYVPDYLDPLDSEAWLQAVSDYAEPGSRRREEQLARIGGFAVPTWPQHFERVQHLLDRLA
jgi:glycosyltransferase involved in cell wall biosynthesis